MTYKIFSTEKKKDKVLTTKISQQPDQRAHCSISSQPPNTHYAGLTNFNWRQKKVFLNLIYMERRHGYVYRKYMEQTMLLSFIHREKFRK